MNHEMQLLYLTVVGHPNEGKSSVVSTLVEDDAIRVSPWPGETRESGEYSLYSGNLKRIFFIDTPGFQSPRRTLEWIRIHGEKAGGKELVGLFLESHAEDPDFKDECGIFRTFLKSAGILYVVDATRPVRKGDLAEMEILRLLGLPRMAVMNPKDTEKNLAEEWKLALRKNFNAIHVFNALSAGFTERIRLLSSLRFMDPDLEALLEPVIGTMEKDWEERLSLSARLMADLVEKVASFRVTGQAGQRSAIPEKTKKLSREWQEGLRMLEKETWETLRGIFRHRFFAPSPDLLILEDTDLFSKESFRAFGLSRIQLAALGGGTAAVLAAGVDLALGGASLGLASLTAGALGAGWAYWGTRNADARRFAGIQISGVELSVGPVRDIRIPWMVLDRSLMLFLALVTRPHAARDSDLPENRSFLHYLESKEQKKLFSLITTASRGALQDSLREEAHRILLQVLDRMAGQKK